MANALKAISKTDDSLTVENHIVLFGGRDLEGHLSPNVNPDGSRGEYFSKSVDLRSPYTNTGVLYVDWEHGYGDDDEPQKDDILGYVDWSTAKADDSGVLVRRILDRRNRYVQMLEPLIEAGLIGTSSEAVSHGVRKSADGEITRWPLRRDTLTVTPMEPRMALGENVLQTVKTLADEWPALKAALFPDDEVIPAEDIPADDIEQPAAEQAKATPEADTPQAGSAPAADAAEPDATHAKRLALEIDLLSLEIDA